ncbi:hypothetical protein FT663_01467 [Candidozyma haemuli var. vulneris]|uniref:Dolichyl-diphosphooligosaccharide--protein glycosyltransferase subunit OST2 n=1 Tax=Candidozyma haemuli TaxID=45357 RepID=A0A2V1AQY6_9ASCO|nr:hypothetical protein CXQ85_003492 [[Candida] haemuloni]KAF3991606.1 hypothetical protein FT662_01604 [[Candida] haemuloni var. vulneris]KAF3994448.1 hypothetical protein FT663_01467 [[Candida] haemuloni var. vulneris]PVH19643.1 hypothetical protein CXQ85_003492 [[Candida] haemuloni]
MAKKDASKKAAAAAQAAVAAQNTEDDGVTAPKTSKGGSQKSVFGSLNDVVGAVQATYKDYHETLTPRLKLIDTLLVFLVALGVLQFVYVLLIGNFPFNAFLGGFISCVGQFVLTVSLRFQYATADKDRASSVFKLISPEVAFGEYVFASLILHFIVFHFIN